jgi:hypothetical protein
VTFYDTVANSSTDGSILVQTPFAPRTNGFPDLAPLADLESWRC